MSYCRWSSDDFASDVYVYESQAGWVIHVAGRRVVFKEPLPPPVEYRGPEDFTALYERHQKVLRMEKDHVPIGLPHDGESFCDPNPGKCADRLEWLKAAGYHVPDGVIETLRKEQDDE